jgi:mRNA-degrading endonuclease RelE of RelBE toxin-antitoxin system
MYSIKFDRKWKEYFQELPDDIKERVAKKIKRIMEGLPGRHLRFGVDFFVEEVGQYRICYKSDEVKKIRTFYFVGTHKDYEKWIGIRKL